MPHGEERVAPLHALAQLTEMDDPVLRLVEAPGEKRLEPAVRCDEPQLRRLPELLGDPSPCLDLPVCLRDITELQERIDPMSPPEELALFVAGPLREGD